MMGFIPDITCRHCGKKFSAIHSRCPHCGAQKHKNSGTLPPKTAPNAETGTGNTAKKSVSGMAAGLFRSNTNWQFLFGCILILLIIVAVIVLISASLNKGGKVPEAPPTPTVEVTTPPPTTPPPTPSPEPTIPVTSIGISFLGSPISEFTQRVGSPDIQLKAEVYPVEAMATAEVEWRSMDETVVTVDQTGLVVAVGPGWGEVVAECGGMAASCKVWVPEN